MSRQVAPSSFAFRTDLGAECGTWRVESGIPRQGASHERSCGQCPSRVQIGETAGHTEIAIGLGGVALLIFLVFILPLIGSGMIAVSCGYWER
ncbi:hypothetical protein RRG08_037878 [Elysia crispata]|uniref:Uncharacterized protein n=1 Tax=Elysia crispata TaxID=231223 RepID=A0AAE1DHF1_9GAST|nr:hypothetical protein RRG08_037878 [Elysia crispata]